MIARCIDAVPRCAAFQCSHDGRALLNPVSEIMTEYSERPSVIINT